MTIPLNAVSFTAEMDPEDVKDYEVDFSSLLDSGETIEAGFTIEVSSEGAALGVSIDTVTNPAVRTGTNTKIQFWPLVDSGYYDNASFSGSGTQVALEFTITTSLGRTYQKTYVLTVAQQ